MKRFCRTILIALPMLWTSLAWAHKASDSYLFLEIQGASLSGRWDIALRDLDYAIGLDANGDGSITWGETKQAQDAFAAYALSRLSVRGDTQNCSLRADGLKIAEHSDGNYASLVLSGSCGAAPSRLTLRYDLLFELDAQHRGLLNLNFGGDVRTGIFAPERRELSFGTGVGETARVFGQYLREGLWHVWSGFDHILFIAGMLLPGVVRRSRGRWVAADSFGATLRESVGIVTAFTLAHAVTLTLAATGAFSPPSRLVESLVAATVLFAGVNNLLPMVSRRLYLIAGGFGLIHGAAIAGALIELGLPAGSRVSALLAFNLGVEAAQLGLIAVLVPLTFRYRHIPSFRRYVLIPASLFVAAAGLVWLLKRAFLLSFDWF